MKPRLSGGRRVWLPTLVALLSLTALSAVVSSRQLEQRVRSEARVDATQTVDAIDGQLDVYIESLYGNRALFQDRDLPTRAQFNQHVQGSRITTRRPGVLGIAYADRVTGDERERFIADARRDIAASGLPYGDFSISPTQPRQEYVVISHIEPQSLNRPAIGFDFLSEPNRRAAVERARDTGMPAATAPLTLVQEAGRQSGFLVMLAQYRSGVALDTVEDRRAAFEGVHYIAVRMGDLIDAVIGESVAPNSSIRIADTGYTGETGFSNGYVVAYSSGSAASTDFGEAISVPLEIGGRQWLVQYLDAGTTVGSVERLLPTFIAVSGLLVSVATTLLLLAALRARRQADANAGQALKLQRLTARLSKSLSVDEVADEAAEEATDLLGSTRAVVTVLNPESTRLQYVGSYWLSLGPQKTQDISVDDALPIAEAVRTRTAIEIEDLTTSDRRGPIYDAMVEAEGARRFVALPLISRDRVVGGMRLTWGVPGPFLAEQRELLHTLATQTAEALERALDFQRERNTALALQERLLPAALPDLPATALAVRYVPTAGGAEVGGDWYDVFCTPGDRIAFGLGDVAGHGLSAATVMGEIRSTMRAYASEGHSPNIVLERMNRLFSSGDGALSTCTFGELDQTSGRVTLVRSGHPPAVLKAASGGSRLISGDPNLPLGVDPDVVFEEVSFFRRPGDVLLLFTDGLVETSGTDLSARLETLRAVVAETSADDVEALTDDVLGRMVPSRQGRDDIALLAIKFDPSGALASNAHLTVQRSFASEPTSARAVRHFVADVLTEWDVGELVDDAVLLSSELVTNSLIHSTDEFSLSLSVTELGVRVEVRDRSDRLPVKVDAANEDTSGRGLTIIDLMAARWGSEPLPTGKAVWFELERNRTAVV